MIAADSETNVPLSSSSRGNFPAGFWPGIPAFCNLCGALEVYFLYVIQALFSQVNFYTPACALRHGGPKSFIDAFSNDAQ